jgi:hypothetical protein
MDWHSSSTLKGYIITIVTLFEEDHPCEITPVADPEGFQGFLLLRLEVLLVS